MTSTAFALQWIPGCLKVAVIWFVVSPLRRSSVLLPDNGEAIAYDPDLNYSWNGVDTNFVLRARGGLRMSAGTSTGRSNRDTCFSDTRRPLREGRDGNDAASWLQTVSAVPNERSRQRQLHHSMG